MEATPPLTGFGVSATAVHSLPRLGTLQERSALEMVVETGDTEVVILNTHLTHRVTPGVSDDEKEDDYATVQIPQLEAALETWDQRPRTVLVGDLNMRPDWHQTEFLLDAGFVDG